MYTPPEWQLEQASDPCAPVNGNPVWPPLADPNPLVEWHEPQLPGFGIGWSAGGLWQLAQDVESPEYTPLEWQLEHETDACEPVSVKPEWS